MTPEQKKKNQPWHREDFDPWSELTKERDGYREDDEADRRRREGY